MEKWRRSSEGSAGKEQIPQGTMSGSGRKASEAASSSRAAFLTAGQTSGTRYRRYGRRSRDSESEEGEGLTHTTGQKGTDPETAVVYEKASFFAIQKIAPLKGFDNLTFSTFEDAYNYKRTLEARYPRKRFRVIRCSPCYPKKGE